MVVCRALTHKQLTCRLSHSNLSHCVYDSLLLLETCMTVVTALFSVKPRFPLHHFCLFSQWVCIFCIFLTHHPIHFLLWGNRGSFSSLKSPEKKKKVVVFTTSHLHPHRCRPSVLYEPVSFQLHFCVWCRPKWFQWTHSIWYVPFFSCLIVLYPTCCFCWKFSLAQHVLGTCVYSS